MDFDSYDPPQTERLLSAGLTRWAGGTERALVTELVAGALVLIASGVIAVLGAPYHGHLAWPDVLLVVLLLLLCQRVIFPTGPVYALPTQLAFVPMFLVLPLGLVPASCIAVRLLTFLVPGRLGIGSPSAKRVAIILADNAYVTGPVVVLLIARVHGFSWNEWPIYAAAMAAQILVDFAFQVGRRWFAERTPPRDLLPVAGWIYTTDICLTCIALFVVASAQQHPGLVLLELPIIGLLFLFSRERKQRMESSVELSSAYKGAAALLGNVLEEDDGYTGVHSREVADLSMAVALRLELNPVQLFNVEYGALLHDVGKIRVPKSILQKQGKLTPEEWKIMREHTVEGEQMLSMVGGSLSNVGRIVRHSHEHYDGSGYPDGLSGRQIPIESRVVSAADAWNAMTTSRPYRRALSVEVAADELKRCAGTHFDPFVVEALLEEVAPSYSDGVLTAAARNARAHRV